MNWVGEAGAQDREGAERAIGQVWGGEAPASKPPCIFTLTDLGVGRTLRVAQIGMPHWCVGIDRVRCYPGSVLRPMLLRSPFGVLEGVDGLDGLFGHHPRHRGA